MSSIASKYQNKSFPRIYFFILFSISCDYVFIVLCFWNSGLYVYTLIIFMLGMKGVKKTTFPVPLSYYDIHIFPRNSEGIDEAEQRKRMRNCWKVEESLCKAFLLGCDVDPRTSGRSKISKIPRLSFPCP